MGPVFLPVCLFARRRSLTICAVKFFFINADREFCPKEKNQNKLRPEDVQAHLIGGIPETEVSTQSGNFTKFGLQSETLFQPDRPGYLAFKESIASRSDIEGLIEADQSVVQTLDTHRNALEQWWSVAP